MGEAFVSCKDKSFNDLDEMIIKSDNCTNIAPCSGIKNTQIIHEERKIKDQCCRC